MSWISNGKMGAITREYKVGNLAGWPNPNKRQHLPPVGFMAFSEAILKAGVFLPLHPFIYQVFQFFDMVPFQLTPNSFRIIIVFFIAFFGGMWV